MLRSLLMTALMVALLGVGRQQPPAEPIAAAEEPVQLRYTWREGDTLRYRMIQVSWSEPPGREAGAVRTTAVSTLRVERVHADGSADIGQVIESLVIGGEPGDGVIDAPLFPGLGDIAIPLIVTSHGEFRPAPPDQRQVGGLHRDAGADPGHTAAQQEDPLLKMLLTGFPSLPEDPVRRGQSWASSETAYFITFAVFAKAAGESVLAAEPDADARTERIETNLRGEGSGISGPGPMAATGERVALIDRDSGRLLRATSSWTLTVPAEQTPAKEGHQLRYEVILELIE